MIPRDFLKDDNEVQTSYEPMPRNFLAEPAKEDLTTSLALAGTRVWEDIKRGIYQTAKNIPRYYQSAKSEIPAAIQTSLSNNPESISSATKQRIAGFAEMGKNIFNTPHDIANYATNRLHLFPENWNEKIQMARMPDKETEEAINQTFGAPNKPGEEFIRGLSRNSLNIMGGTGISNLLNPLKLTNKGIAKNVVKELNNQVDRHTEMYDQLWKDANNRGINRVPYDPYKLIGNYLTIDKYTTPKQHRSLIDFFNNPTLANAQKAQSDIGIVRRAIEERSRTTPLLGEERKLYDALDDTQKHIEENMFKDSLGHKNQKMADRYQAISNSYRQNVVPYRYNPDIQSYLNKELTAKELVERLNKGEFAAKKGSKHASFALRKSLLPIATGIGAIGGGKYLFDQIMGNNNQVEENE